MDSLFTAPSLRLFAQSEDGRDQVAKLPGGNDTSGEDAQPPNDREVAGTVFGSQDLVVDEMDQKVGLLLRGSTAAVGREEAFLCRAVETAIVK